MENEQIEVPDITEAQDEEIAPTKTVKTFWERLDEVFKMNLQSQQMRESLNDLLEQFGDTQSINQRTYQSFVFQPDRVAITSSDDITRVTTQPGNLAIDLSGTQFKSGPYGEQFFDSFRIRLDKGLVNVKSIQLLSCTLPNIVPSIPNYSTGFFFYRLRTLQSSQLPNWSAVTPYLQYDTVFYPRTGQAYQALNSSTNVPPTTAANWSPVPTYDNTATYAAPKVVYNPTDMTYYRCLSGPTITGIPPPNPTYWKALGAYDNTVLYNTGDIVQSTVDNAYYVCIGTNIVGQEPSVSATFTKLTTQGTAPNFFDLTPDFLNVIYFHPSNGYPQDAFLTDEQQTINRRFIDYNDLLISLNVAANDPLCCAGVAPPGTLSFTQFQANDTSPVYFRMNPKLAPLTIDYYYLPAGFADPNIPTFVSNLPTNANNEVYASIFAQNFVNQYTLNTRLGFTWNGSYPSPYLINPYTAFYQSCSASLYYFMRPQWINPTAPTFPLQKYLTANTSADLVNTSCVRIYSDFVFGSTQDSEGKGGLLSIVPVNANNNAVGFYQNNFNNPLLKVPKLITEIGISMTDDQGLPYYLPNSGTVLLELAVTYY